MSEPTNKEQAPVAAPGGEYVLWDFTGGEKGAQIAVRDHVRGAARQAARIIRGDELVGGETEAEGGRWVSQVLVTGPDIEDRYYDYRFRNTAYKYRVRCHGPVDEEGNPTGKPCRNTVDPWMHPTTPQKRSLRCIHCWSPTKSMRKKLSDRNRRMNPVLRPRSRASRELFF